MGDRPSYQIPWALRPGHSHSPVRQRPARQDRPLVQKRDPPDASSSSQSSSRGPDATGLPVAALDGFDTTTTGTATPVGTPTATLTGGASSSLLNSTSYSSSHPYKATTTSDSSTSSIRTKPWTYAPSPSYTTSGSDPAASAYVPGVIFNMTLGGVADHEAVYSIPMAFGHDSSSSSSSANDRRQTTTKLQVMGMQVDLGSSDMWVASADCTTSNCKTAPKRFDASDSLGSGTDTELNFHSGTVRGEICWEQVQIGGFGIGYQAFVAGDTIYNEDLRGGNFSGLLGLALPANSIITQEIPGTTGSSPDGATFLDNLFGAGSSAPSQRLFSISLARPQDVRTFSTFGIGEVFETLCPAPCKPAYVSIVPHDSLGKTGYLHWRVRVDRVSFTTFSDPQAGSGAMTQTIPLGPSQTNTKSDTPIAVLDTGGLPILVGYRQYVNAIYGAYNIGPSQDGLYRMPCSTQIALTFTIGGKDYPVHPLDMSWPDPGDSTGKTCIGALQYADGLANRGDFVLGSSFLKNVYTVYQYPDQKKSSSAWQPTVGFLSLTDRSRASKDFYAVRSLGQTLSTVSSEDSAPGSTGGNPQASAAAAAGNKKVVSTAVIVASSVVGFLVLVALAFCAWWFWQRRKNGASGSVEYKMAAAEPDTSTDTFTMRKHLQTKRQKSMVDGYSDYDESWRSTTEGANSIQLAHLPEEHADDRTRASTWTGDAISNHTRGSSLHQSLLTGDPGSPLVDFAQHPDTPPPMPVRRQSASYLSPPASARLVDLPPTPASAASHRPGRPGSMAMAGPFPSATRQSIMSFGSGHHGEEEYFPIFPEPAAPDRRRSQSAPRLSRRPT